MSGLAALLARRRPPGVYRWHSSLRAAHVAHAVEHAGDLCFVLDGAAVTSEAAFLDACAGVFAPPEWSGRNWDALRDRLTDLSWAPARGYVVLYDGWGMLARTDAGAWSAAYDVLAAAVERWRDTGTPMSVLLRGLGPELDVPWLDDLPGGSG
jgi:hypothetical protein